MMWRYVTVHPKTNIRFRSQITNVLHKHLRTPHLACSVVKRAGDSEVRMDNIDLQQGLRSCASRTTSHVDWYDIIRQLHWVFNHHIKTHKFLAGLKHKLYKQIVIPTFAYCHLERGAHAVPSCPQFHS